MPSHTASALPRKSGSALIFVLAMLSAFAPVATDMYLPAFSHMAQAYGTQHGRIEATLSAFFLGLAVGQAFYGPLIDRFGRRMPLLCGVGLFVLATMGCLLTRNIEVLTAMRFLQAVGGCAGMIVGRAVIRDLFGATESARVLSLLLMLMTTAPIVAPLLGGWILAFAGWQAIFVFMLAFALVCGLLVWVVVPETLPLDQRMALNPRSILRGYTQLLRKRSFIVPALVGGLAQSCMFAYITGSSFVFMGHFGVSERNYGLLFGLIALGLVVGAQINRIGLRRYRIPSMLGSALALNTLATIALVAVVPADHLPLLLLPMWVAIGTLGLIGGNAAALAMAASGEHAGSGSALIGVLQFGCAFIVSAVVAATQNGTAYPMALAMMVVSLAATALWFGVGGSKQQ